MIEENTANNDRVNERDDYMAGLHLMVSSHQSEVDSIISRMETLESEVEAVHEVKLTNVEAMLTRLQWRIRATRNQLAGAARRLVETEGLFYATGSDPQVLVGRHANLVLAIHDADNPCGQGQRLFMPRLMKLSRAYARGHHRCTWCGDLMFYRSVGRSVSVEAERLEGVVARKGFSRDV